MKTKPKYTPNTPVLIGKVAVDSGQIMLTDPCYALNDGKSERGFQEGGSEFAHPDINDLYPYSYMGACGATLSEDSCGSMKFALGHEGAGVVVSTGYGDGLYPVFVTYNDEGRIASVHIVFIDGSEGTDEDDDQ
jgi:hypothetical protein